MKDIICIFLLSIPNLIILYMWWIGDREICKAFDKLEKSANKDAERS